MGSSSSCSTLLQCLLENRLSFPVCGAPVSLQVVRSWWIWFSGVLSCSTEKLGVDWIQRVLFFLESGGLLVWMWWGAINHDSHALWATDRVWLLLLLCWVGAGRKRRRLKLGARMGRCPNHKNSHGKHYSHKTARRAKFLVKDILATTPFFSFSFSCFPVSSSDIGYSSSMLWNSTHTSAPPHFSIARNFWWLDQVIRFRLF
jgi:hypothetical protein